MFRKDFVGRANHVSVAREIQPVARPAFTVGGRGEQAVDDLGVGCVGLVVRKGNDLFGGGGESREVEADAPNPGVAVGVAGGLEALGFLFSEKEAINRILRPGGVFDGWGGRIRDRLEGPELASFREIDGAFGLGGLGGFAGACIGRAPLHPFLKDGHFVRWQPAFGRHGEVGVKVAHGLDDEAFGEVARDDGRAIVAAMLPAGARIKGKSALGLFL